MELAAAQTATISAAEAMQDARAYRQKHSLWLF
jgi:hypothetical protein